MEPRIENRKAFTVLGIQSRVKQGSETSELFARIWEKFEAKSDLMEPLSLSKKYYGVNFPSDQEDTAEYLAGVMVSHDSPVPFGLVKRNVQGGDYAVIRMPFGKHRFLLS